MSQQPKGLASLPPVRWAMVHPLFAAWIVLSIGIVTLLIIEARDIGATPGQWAALIIACIVVSGLCVLIIASEDNDEEDQPADTDKPV
jgi:hypothetical protein